MEQFKRQQIVDTAMHIFKEKGYFAASMQDIAEACSMAKASIYKVFPSKEDLFTGIFVEVHRTLFEESRSLERTLRLEGHPPKENLRRKIAFQLQFMLENYFFTSEFKDLPITSNENFLNEWRKKRATLLAMHHDCFHEAYGEPIVPYLGDTVAIFRGMLKEYLTHLVQAVIAVPTSELAGFLVDRMDVIVGDLITSSAEPILKASSAYFNDISPLNDETRQTNLKEFLKFFVVKIEELPQPERIRNELLEVIDLLQRELEQPEPNGTLLRVYITFLDTVSDLKPYVHQLVLLLNINTFLIS
ncbi:TetR/AcrR family transcriptional regulator [Paenibacillus radicis (ex Xue et al. 2023)]|uniref:TetR/AcrR family transcriptional regulator n=1 Tax=Paenibacillus radicis (ex Xue et al. 2023) TaxID=2972489 RepID=A0ABT1YFZ3_9BACL|nr:TetR/AcrR family transcriptional regulator [Paenibacillus radicis (ex Xue et al. 2023)]MCR8632117.1 TetR/AcrR family transcriptional regulator [Paenibacillus radicis (ex Xue et al. 2023)]